MTCAIHDEAKKRPIQRIIWPGDDPPIATVGKHGLQRIDPVEVEGGLGHAVWLRCEYDDGAIRLVNVAHIDTIEFAAQPPSEVKL